MTLATAADALRYLGFGFVCFQRSIPFADVRRFGHAVVTNRGRRERHLLFELHTRELRTVKLAMYRDAARAIELLTERLGAPAPTTATVAGARFVDG